MPNTFTTKKGESKYDIEAKKAFASLRRTETIRRIPSVVELVNLVDSEPVLPPVPNPLVPTAINVVSPEDDDTKPKAKTAAEIVDLTIDDFFEKVTPKKKKKSVKHLPPPPAPRLRPMPRDLSKIEVIDLAKSDEEFLMDVKKN
jgi:hypothetical protein